MRNYYEILEVPTHAAKKEIRKAYLQKCKQFHPDLHDGAEWAEVRLKEVNEAYETLSDTFRRNDYDIQLLQIQPKEVKPYKEKVIPSFQEIKQRPVWLYGSILAVLLWLAVGAIAVYQPQSSYTVSPALKNEYRRFLEFCKKHPQLITRSEFEIVLENEPVVGFTFELERLIAKRDTIAVRQRIQALKTQGEIGLLIEK
ncbi:MAG: DnaJ domain-containing protein [Bacteroidota bacterium]